MDYYDIDVFKRQISTKSDAAQLWFNRGLTWCYAYFHDEAASCFEQAIKAEPTCAMAHWGVACAAGPNYNLPWDKRDDTMRETSLKRAYDACQAALKASMGLSDTENGLIKALALRFPQAIPTDLATMEGWNADFARAMGDLFQTNPQDLDIRAIYVAALMNLTPWAMWDQKTGAPGKGAQTLEAQEILEEAFDTQSGAWTHPGLLHLYVHLMEMSPTPEKALKAGDALRDLIPDAGHLIHMPTHIDIQCGDYAATYAWNRRAVEADRKARDRFGVYTVYTGYRIHNYHFATYGAMFLGQFDAAWASARELVEDIPEDMLRMPSPPFADFYESYFAVPVHVLIRFGRWQQIIDEPLPDDRALYSNLTATLHYAKGVAHAALGQVPEAEAERRLFHTACKAIPKARRMHNVLCSEQQAVAAAMLDGEIEYRKGNYDLAFKRLRDAVALEDALPYDEPWGWMQPVRHALGALLLEQGRIEEAENTYREDLGLTGTLPRAQIHPDNVWSLRGLNACFTAKGDTTTTEARLIAQHLHLAEARADPSTGVSCFCAAG